MAVQGATTGEQACWKPISHLSPMNFCCTELVPCSGPHCSYKASYHYKREVGNHSWREGGWWNPRFRHQPAIRLTPSNYETPASLQAGFKVVFFYGWHLFPYKMHTLIITLPAGLHHWQLTGLAHQKSSFPFYKGKLQTSPSAARALRAVGWHLSKLSPMGCPKTTHLGKWF